MMDVIEIKYLKCNSKVELVYFSNDNTDRQAIYCPKCKFIKLLKVIQLKCKFDKIQYDSECYNCSEIKNCIEDI